MDCFRCRGLRGRKNKLGLGFKNPETKFMVAGQENNAKIGFNCQILTDKFKARLGSLKNSLRLGLR